MRFNVPMPPRGDDRDLYERVERLTGWLYVLAQRLNTVLENLGEENFSAATAKKLFEREDENDTQN